MELFLKNCAVDSLEVRASRDAAELPLQRSFAQPYILVGRDARCDLTLDDPQVSRRHAYVQAVAGRLLVVDLGSRTGVHWPAGPRTLEWFNRDEPFRIGGAALQVSSTPARADQAALVPRGEPTVVFEATGGASGAQRWSMRQPFALVGAAEACKVRLGGEGVSRYHCGLVKGPLGVWVVDLLSRAGTHVNGQKVSCAPLEDGARLQVGQFVIRVWYETAGQSVSPLTVRPVPAVDQSLLLPVMNEFNLMQKQMLDQFHQTMLMMAEMFTNLHREQSGLVREELDQLRRLTQELTTLQTERARQQLGAPAAASGADSAKLPAPLPRTEPTPVAFPPQGPQPATVPFEAHDWLSRRIVALQEERQGRWQKLLRLVRGGG